MKRIVDKLIGLVLGIIAIYVGFAVVAELVRPYVGSLLMTVGIVGCLVALVFVGPMLFGAGKRLTDRFSNSGWS